MLKQSILMAIVLLSYLQSTATETKKYLLRSTIICSNSEYSVHLTIENNQVVKAKVAGWLDYEVNKPSPSNTSSDGVSKYEFIVDDSNDTKISFSVTLKGTKVVGREIYESGNDADNYYGYSKFKDDAAFICSAAHFVPLP